MRIPFLRPKPEAPAAKPARARSKPPVDDPAGIEAARTQARRRLVGALVLLMIGVVGFPVLFETQPRPLPMDTPIVAPRRDAVASGQVLNETQTSRQPNLAALPADAGNEMPPSVPASAATAARSEKAPAVVPVPAPVLLPPKPGPALQPASAAARTTASAAASTTTTSAPTQPAKGLTVSTSSSPAPTAAAVTPAAPATARPMVTAAPIPAASSPAKPAAIPTTVPAQPAAPKVAVVASTPATGSAAASGAATVARYVVQAGAYSEAGKLREARSKIEGMGLKTYTQVIDGEGGSRTRVRVGPFDSKADAEAVAAKIKRGGLPAAVLAL